jgi:Predicted Zn-dependent protease (DUF2268)
MSLSGRIIGGVLLAVALWQVSARADTPPKSGLILIDDVERFYRVYDAAQRRPIAEQLRTGYIDPGTDGLHQFAKLRDLTGATLAAAIDKRPQIFAKATECKAVLPAVRKRLDRALARLGELYPAARFPPVTVLIGRGNTGGTTSATAVLIGMETLCSADWMNPDLEDRFVHLIAHEYAHVQQPAGNDDVPPGSVLETALIEGGAEFVAELISGDIGNSHLRAWTKGHELEIETRFAADEDSKDLKPWLWSGPGTPDKPGDLGYWVGYRIVKSYYLHAKDKKAALRDIFLVNETTAKDFLARSRWYPGMTR